MKIKQDYRDDGMTDTKLAVKAFDKNLCGLCG